MRVLFVTEAFPYPLDTGGNVRTFNLLRGLAKEHEVSLIATAREPIPESHLREVATVCRQVRVAPARTAGLLREGQLLAASLLAGTPYSVARHHNEAVRREIARAFEAPQHTGGNGAPAGRSGAPFDAVHFNHLDAALYHDAVPAGVPCVLDEHNIVSNQAHTMAASEERLARRVALAREARVLRRFEARACNRMRRCLVCSDIDAQSLRQLGVMRPITVIPNGVDLTYFTSREPAQADSPEIVFVGTLDYDPCERGVWFFCREILPRVHAQMPEVRFVAVGRNPSPRLRTLANADRRIELTGRVPDVRPYVRRAKVFVAPLLSGSGTRLKILEAFALGAAVVATTIAAEGIACVPGEHLMIADEPDEFASAVLHLVRHPDRADGMRARGRRLVQERYGWDRICGELLRVYGELAMGA